LGDDSAAMQHNVSIAQTFHHVQQMGRQQNGFLFPPAVGKYLLENDDLPGIQTGKGLIGNQSHIVAQ
jgi:hypothetical protein